MKPILFLLQVVSALLDFLYTGEMTVDREDTADLQRLIETLQIDPDLITVDIVEQKVSAANGNIAQKEIDEKESPSKITDEQKPVSDNLPTKPVSTDDKVVDNIITDTDDKKRKLADQEDDEDQDGVESKKSKKVWPFHYC